MPRDGQGQYSPPLSNWNPAVDGNEADPAGWNQYRDDVSAAISQSVSTDGQTLMTGPLNMGGQRIQSLAAPIGNGHALRRGQLIKGANIASAATIDIPNEGALFEVTGTVTIEHITGAFDGRLITLLFQDELIIKNGLDIVLPLSADIKTNPGLMLQIQRIENNKWSVISYPKATETAPGVQRAARRLVTTVPIDDQGPIDLVGVGPMNWDGDKYAPIASENIGYDNTDSELAAEDVQAAIDELQESAAELESSKLPISAALGIDQAYEAVTRLLDVTYHNTTGRPIILYVRASGTISPQGRYIEASINNAGPIRIAWGYSANDIVYIVGSILIPLDASYVLTGTADILESWELR